MYNNIAEVKLPFWKERVTVKMFCLQAALCISYTFLYSEKK